MHLVGSDALAVVDGAAVPAGHWHAVGAGQRSACSDAKPRFLWPALAWDALLETACATCAQTVSPPADAYLADPYPAEGGRGHSTALVLWQPSARLFEAPGTASS